MNDQKKDILRSSALAIIVVIAICVMIFVYHDIHKQAQEPKVLETTKGSMLGGAAGPVQGVTGKKQSLNLNGTAANIQLNANGTYTIFVAATTTDIDGNIVDIARPITINKNMLEQQIAQMTARLVILQAEDDALNNYTP